MALEDPVVVPNAKAEREAREMRSRRLTEEIKELPLPAVMERLFGIAGEKASAGWLKYRLGDGTLLSVQTDGPSFGSLDGRKFTSLGNKPGGNNAINLVLAVKEANAQSADFVEARTLLQRTFLPHTVESYGIKKDGPKIGVGDVDLSILFHRDAVILDNGRFDLVLSAWDPSLWRTGAVTVVECDAEGVPVPGAKERVHSNTPDLFIAPAKKTHGPIVVARSMHPLIPDGLRSTDASLLLVPHGPFRGFMLGELNQEQLATLRTESRSDELRQAIEATKPLTLRWAQKMRSVPETMQERRVDPPEPLNFIRLNDRLVDNRRLTREYLTNRRGLSRAIADDAIAANQIIPFENQAPIFDRAGHPIAGQFEHHAAFAIPYTRWGESKPIGYQLKVIFDPPPEFKRKDSWNFGPIADAYTLIGEWSPRTRDVVIVEAYIDGLSYKQLKEPPESTCILVSHGLKVPTKLLDEAVSRDIKITTGLDNDYRGRETAMRIQEECEKRGLRYANEVPGPLSEIRVAFRANDAGHRRLTALKEFCDWKHIAYVVRPEERRWLPIVVDNTWESAKFINDLKVQDEREAARLKVESVHQKAPPANVVVRYENKDWNDQLKGNYRRTVGLLQSRTADEVDPRELTPTPDIVEERTKIAKFLHECTVSHPEAKEVWIAEVSQELRRTGKDISKLTLGEMHRITERAASLWVDRLQERLVPELPEVQGFDALGFVADMKRLARDYLDAKPADRAIVEKELDRITRALSGPGTTTVPLKVAARDFVYGRGSVDTLTQRAVRHAAVVAERIGQGIAHRIETRDRDAAHTR